MQVTLYGSQLSPFVEKVIRGVQRKGLTWELRVPKRRHDMDKWNPTTGRMPAADLGGERLFDSTFILRRLDALVPNPPLVSRDPVVAAQQRTLEDWADESLHWCLRTLRWSPSNARATADEIFEEIDLARFLRPYVARAMRLTVRGQVERHGVGRIPAPLLLRELSERLDDLVRMLGDRKFFFGDELSVADLAVFGQLRYADVPGAPDTQDAVRKRPALVDYVARVDRATGTN